MLDKHRCLSPKLQPWESRYFSPACWHEAQEMRANRLGCLQWGGLTFPQSVIVCRLLLVVPSMKEVAWSQYKSFSGAWWKQNIWKFNTVNQILWYSTVPLNMPFIVILLASNIVGYATALISNQRAAADRRRLGTLTERCHVGGRRKLAVTERTKVMFPWGAQTVADSDHDRNGTRLWIHRAADGLLKTTMYLWEQKVFLTHCGLDGLLEV